MLCLDFRLFFSRMIPLESVKKWIVVLIKYPVRHFCLFEETNITHIMQYSTMQAVISKINSKMRLQR